MNGPTTYTTNNKTLHSTVTSSQATMRALKMVSPSPAAVSSRDYGLISSDESTGIETTSLAAAKALALEYVRERLGEGDGPMSETELFASGLIGVVRGQEWNGRPLYRVSR